MDGEKRVQRLEVAVLLASVFLIAICGIVYELSIGNISSYLMGNSVLQYSLTIGTFMFAMGVGSFLSRFITKNIIDKFIFVEIAIGFTGGFSAVFLLYCYSTSIEYSAAMFMVIMIIGTFVGVEIPLLTRLIDIRYKDLKVSISNALGFDYIGALAGSLAFSLFMLPKLGILKTSYILGLVNMLVVAINIAVYFRDLVSKRLLVFLSMSIVFGLLLGMYAATDTEAFLEQKLYKDKVIHVEQSRYQKIVITQNKEDLRLFIDGNIQFSSIDEHRYHEALVHPAMSLLSHRENILILGGGDGLAARELLKYKDVKSVTLVDLDKAMTDLCSTNKEIVGINRGALSNPKVKIINEDAYKYIEHTNQGYDLVIVDLPDPNNEALSKLYSSTFYNIIAEHLNPGGFVVVQSTSPFFSSKVYWCIRQTVEGTGLHTTGYHIDVPSFGDWGFTLASNKAFDPEDISVKVDTKFLDDKQAKAMFIFGKDLARQAVKDNTIINPVILEYYQKSWQYWN